MLDDFRNDFIKKITELKDSGYVFYEKDGSILYHKKTDIPVGESGYLDNLIKDWLLYETKLRFDKIMSEEIEEFISWRQ